jgi:hypothetical protein
MRRKALRCPVILAAALGMASLASPVAIGADVEPPPQPNRQLTLVSPLGGYAIMALAAAGLVGISLIRARRGEQD